MGMFLLQVAPDIAQQALEEKETGMSLVKAASIIIMVVTLAGWFVAYRLFRIEKQGLKYYFVNLALAVIYVPFLVKHFFDCREMDFRSGTEHYLFALFVHTIMLVLWSLGFYGKNKQEDYY